MSVSGVLRWVAAAVVVVAGLAALLLELAPAVSGRGGTESGAPTPAPRASERPVPREAPVPAAGPDPAAELADAAAAAVTAWQVPDATDRTAALTPLATPSWLEQSATIDPSRVPASEVSQSQVRVESDGLALVDVELSDGTALAVMLLLADDGRWLVDEILPTVPAAAGGAR